LFNLPRHIRSTGYGIDCGVAGWSTRGWRVLDSCISHHYAWALSFFYSGLHGLIYSPCPSTHSTIQVNVTRTSLVCPAPSWTICPDTYIPIIQPSVRSSSSLLIQHGPIPSPLPLSSYLPSPYSSYTLLINVVILPSALPLKLWLSE
jgi:hypothetical protein